MHSVLRMEKKFSAKALSYGFPLLDIDGVMPYLWVSLKYAAVAVGISAFRLTFPDPLCQRQILRRGIHALYIVVISAARYAKEAAHLTDAIFLPVTIDDPVFDACPHFLCRSRFSSPFTTSFPLSPNFSAICRCVHPFPASCLTTGNSSCTFSYFLGIIIPPYVVLSFSYLGGVVYYPFLLVRFKPYRGNFF